jgi:putative flippase GtrA
VGLVAEATRYLTTQAVGAATNLMVFVALIESLPLLKGAPIIPLAAGAAFGLLVNYFASANWVFAPR